MGYAFRAIFVLSFLVFLISCSKEISTTQPVETGKGKIIVDSNPQGAEIFLNNENTGLVTPDSIIDLEVGTYNVLLKMDLFLDTSFTIDLSENERQSIYVDYYSHPRNFGTIVCNTNPEGASIFINDSSTGLSTPKTIQFLWPGNYKVKLTYPEHRADSTSFTLQASEIQNINLVLQDTSVWVDYHMFNSDFPTMHATCIEIDHNNTIWVGTRNAGLIKYQTNEWTQYTYHNSGLHTQWIKRIAIDKNNIIWLGTSTGLAKFNGTNWTIYTKNNCEMPIEDIETIAVDDNNNIWLGSWDINEKGRLVKFDGINWTMYPTPSLHGIQSLVVDRDNNIWVSAYTQTFVFNQYEFIDPPIDHIIFNESMISSSLMDEAGVLWFCMKTYFGRPNIYYYDGIELGAINIPDIIITKIIDSPKGNKWITCCGESTSDGQPAVTDPHTEKGGVIKIDPYLNVSRFTYANSDLTVNTCSDVAVHPNGDVWVTLRYGGIIKFKDGDIIN